MGNIYKNLRKEILTTIYKAKSGHPGGSFSGVELLYTLYSEFIKFDPKNPNEENRDRVIISKGHASPLVYSILSEFGFFPKSELEHFRKFGALLQGHVSKTVPGVELSTGSLGQGLSYSCGVAIAGFLKKANFKVFCYMGDGELQEGSVWESFMTAGDRNLNNLCAIIDYNKVQENGFVKDIKNLEPLKEKLEAFGWKVFEIDGHNVEEIRSAYHNFFINKEKPVAIIANTVKGKGVSFMEFKSSWHGKAPNEEEYNKAIKELEVDI
ncbi:transketolase [Cetobacterium sp. 8H]|uniref:transketolase n=1 Tax=Cetobacterium sp. 8H TaxID=2759681 RepID=UPI00163B99C7|nr:transketolase [Cetobacterium sp. 8H]MBC2851572.1 transketolase [Cetobacterium sp. 8H]